MASFPEFFESKQSNNRWKLESEQFFPKWVSEQVWEDFNPCESFGNDN